MVCKFFGMYLYVDKYDYVLNNINTGDIDDEIFEIEKKIGVIEVSNLDYFDRYFSA